MIANSSLPHNHNHNPNLNPSPAPRRRNPIERLPSSIREQVNLLIDDDKPFPEILQWLANSGHPSITQADLTVYAEGPFQRWVRDHERMDRFAAQQDIATDLTKGENLHNFNTASVAIAQLNLFDLLNRFDITTLTKRIEEKPELWFQLISAFCSFSRLQLARDKFEWQKKQAEAKQRAREVKQRASHIVITAATGASLRALLNNSPVRPEVPVEQPAVPDVPDVQPPVPAPDITVSLSRRLRQSPPCTSPQRSTSTFSVGPLHRHAARQTDNNRFRGIQCDPITLEHDPFDALVSSPS